MSASHIEVRLSIPEGLYRIAERCASEGGFGSVENLVRFLMEGVLSPRSEELDAEELQAIEERLRDLGYL